MKTAEIEKRLASVEREVAELKAARRPDAKSHPVRALEAIHGTFKPDEAFEQAMRLGRKWRKSQHSNARKSTAKRS
jgi:hypothetical protein